MKGTDAGDAADGSAPGTGPPYVFINYRRDDASGHAGRLYDALAGRFGGERVFMDVDAIRPGENFAMVLDRSVGSCDVLIALIGRRWTTAVDREGRRRLERPEDYVRLELETALASGRTRVIPALVQGAEMPGSDELPASMRALAMRQAIELSDARWRTDVERLIRALEEESAGPAVGDSDPVVGTSTARTADPTARRRRGGRRRLTGVLAAAGLALAVTAAALGVILTSSGGSAPPAHHGVTTAAAKKTKLGPATAKPAATHAPAAPRYAIYAADGYQAQLPTGPDWSRPAQVSYGGGRRVRAIVRGPGGAFVAIDYTPRDKPQFSARYESKTELSLAAFGSAMRYVFRGGSVAECDQWRCVDFQVGIPDTSGGLGVVAGGPDFAQTAAMARTVAQSLTPPAGG